MASGDKEYEGEGEGEGEEDYIDLDLEKTLTWTGNAVVVQAGGEFRLPLIVPHTSVLAIQFEVDGGYDIEFSLLFKDDHENDYQVVSLSPPRRACASTAFILRTSHIPPLDLLSTSTHDLCLCDSVPLAASASHTKGPRHHHFIRFDCPHCLLAR